MTPVSKIQVYKVETTHKTYYLSVMHHMPVYDGFVLTFRAIGDVFELRPVKEALVLAIPLFILKEMTVVDMTVHEYERLGGNSYGII